ncbi:MAG: helix-turn-helix transcriptional regulator [Betaproteobacteria bacterium]|nr:helix-turn-helix transcriptional regulator [Betaproteobacteria bacterium]
MSSKPTRDASIVGRRMRERREALALAQEIVGVSIGLDESCARNRISRYELGVHEPPLNTMKLLAHVLQVPLPYFYCENEDIARLLLALHALPAKRCRERVGAFLRQI